MSTKSNTRIERRFATLKREGKKGFIAYITAGDPDLEATEDIVLRLEDAGADIVELGVPFSDPLADGPANQRAAERALAGGTTLPKILAAVSRIRERSEIPLLFFSYLNPLCARGFDRTIKRAAKSGIDAALLVDLSMEDSEPFHDSLHRHGMNHIVLVTPTTPEKRIRAIAKTGSGFVYCVSRAGVTGEQDRVQDQARNLLRKTARCTSLPVALGFGVSSPEQARTYAGLSDAVVVGSYIVNAFHAAGNTRKGRQTATRNIERLINAVKEV